MADNEIPSGELIGQIVCALTAGAVSAVAEEFGQSMAGRASLEIALHDLIVEHHHQLALATRAAWECYERERRSDGGAL